MGKGLFNTSAQKKTRQDSPLGRREHRTSSIEPPVPNGCPGWTTLHDFEIYIGHLSSIKVGLSKTNAYDGATRPAIPPGTLEKCANSDISSFAAQVYTAAHVYLGSHWVPRKVGTNILNIHVVSRVESCPISKIQETSGPMCQPPISATSDSEPRHFSTLPGCTCKHQARTGASGHVIESSANENAQKEGPCIACTVRQKTRSLFLCHL